MFLFTRQYILSRHKQTTLIAKDCVALCQPGGIEMAALV